MGNQEYLFLLLKDLSQAMEMVESQTLLLSLLALKVRAEPLSCLLQVEGQPLSAAQSPLA